MRILGYISQYKGGDDASNQDVFLNGKANLMVATKAFGMGIDKPNVRMTIHMNYPGSLESFVQEAGRAGRDKKMALATIMYSSKKFNHQNIKTRLIDNFSADYITNKFFYDNNFLGEGFEVFVMQMLMTCHPVTISNEEIRGDGQLIKESIKGITTFINSYPNGNILTYYISYKEEQTLLNYYNGRLRQNLFPIFLTEKQKEEEKKQGRKWGYGYADYKNAIQKAIYRMCVIGLIDDFTEDYWKKKFRITTICQEESHYYKFLGSYYRKHYSEDRVSSMIEEVKQMAQSEGVIMACLRHLTSFVYRSIADKRARGIMDMEQFCNMAVNSNKDWKETNEDLKDFIYYYFNSKYAREGFVTYDASVNSEVPYSLKDDTDIDKHSETETTSFELVKKYMRVVDADIVNNDAQKDNIKHLQGAVRLIRRAAAEMNPVLNLLNIFCILFLGQEENEMLEEELINDYKAVFKLYVKNEKTYMLNEYTELLIQHAAISENQRGYIEKIQNAAQLEIHLEELKELSNKYIKL